MHWREKSMRILYKDKIRTSQETLFASVRKTSLFMLQREK